jgi:GTP-binding protein
MRREGFELMVGPPTVIEKTIDGVKCEPFEIVDITVPNDFSSAVVSLLNKRKGEMTEMGPAEGSEGQTQLKFVVPTRGMIGIRSALLTATKGTLVLDTVFDSYRPCVGPIQQREKGSLLAFEDGEGTTFGIGGAQDRGRMFVNVKDPVYKDMIIGVHQRPGDLAVNICKTKALTNMRAAGNDDAVKIVPPLELNLDIAVEYIAEDELVEVTPTQIRMLKHPQWKTWAKNRRDL